ncbi:MAG: desulfoferrodoxin family protein [Minisyncoccales bacterium]
MIFEPTVEEIGSSPAHFPIVEIDSWDKEKGAIVEIEIIGNDSKAGYHEIDFIKISNEKEFLGKIELTKKLEPRVTFFLEEIPKEISIESMCKIHGKTKTTLKDIKTKIEMKGGNEKNE